MRSTAFGVEQAVQERYSKSATAREAELCCPVEYEPRYLEVIPEEIIDLMELSLRRWLLMVKA